MAVDRLTSQLVEIADVVGDLGRNIAAAQKLLNKDYIKSLQALMTMARNTLGTDAAGDDRAAVMLSLLKDLSPSRYQFTETTIEFGADLAESKQRSTMIGGGATFKMLQVNAAMTQGYGHDYRASARITATIHAYSDPQFADRLIGRAADIAEEVPALPAPTELDGAIQDAALEIWHSLGAATAPADHE